MAKGTLTSKPKSPQSRTNRCRATKGLTKWCFGVCQPVRGIGFCGRAAPHALRGRTQQAIARQKARAKKEAKREECHGSAA